MRTCSLVRQLFANSDIEGCLSVCLSHLEADGRGGAVMSEAGFIATLVSGEGAAAAQLLRLAQRGRSRDRLTIVRRALVRWMFTGEDKDVLDTWHYAHLLEEEDDETRCWATDALLEAERGGLDEAKTLIEDILGKGRRLRVNAHAITSWAVLLEKTGFSCKARAAAAVAVSFTEQTEISLDMFRSLIAQLHTGTVIIGVEAAAVEAHRVYLQDVSTQQAADMLQEFSTIDIIMRTMLARGLAFRIYGRLLRTNGEHISAEFFLLLALSALKFCHRAHPLVLQTLEELADLYMAMASGVPDTEAQRGHDLRLAAVDVYESIISHGENEQARERDTASAVLNNDSGVYLGTIITSIISVTAGKPAIGICPVDPAVSLDVDSCQKLLIAHEKPVLPLLPSVVTWLLPRARADVPGPTEEEEEGGATSAVGSNRRVRMLCCRVRQKLLALLVAAGNAHVVNVGGCIFEACSKRRGACWPLCELSPGCVYGVLCPWRAM
jgi:hypothetical protein